jgi:hypothetical protein
VDPAGFTDLFHFDPWWVFRGMGGIHDPWKGSILPTNVAKPFAFERHHWKIHDVQFEDGGEGVRAIIAKEEMFRTRSFARGNFDLGVLRPRA